MKRGGAFRRLLGGMLLLSLLASGALFVWLSRSERPQPTTRAESVAAPAAAGQASIGRVFLDIDGAELRVEAGPPGTRIRFEAEYDADLYELKDHWSENW